MNSKMMRFKAEGFRFDVRVWYTELNIALKAVDSHGQNSKDFIQEATIEDGTYVTMKITHTPYETIV